MKIHEEVLNNSMVLRFEGDLDTNTSAQAEAYIDETFAKGNRSLIINFNKLGYISSAGLRVLLLAAKRAKSESGSLRICELNGDVKDVFELSGFDSFLDIFESEEEALRSY